MSKITYTDKVALNQNPNVQDINKVNATDMNEIKNVVNSNETKVLLAVTDTAPAQCSTGDMYYDTTDDLIYTATGTNTWSSTGVAPTENTIYVVYDTQTAYAYDGNTLISVGGGTGSSDIVMVYPDTATAETKLYIDEEDLSYQGLEIANSYNTSNSMAYSCAYINGDVLFEDANGSSGEITLSDSTANYRKIEIEYSDWDANVYSGSSVFYSPNGKLISLFLQRYQSNSSILYTAATRYSVSGNKITPDLANSGLARSSGSNTSSQNYILIRKVIGYK